MAIFYAKERRYNMNDEIQDTKSHILSVASKIISKKGVKNTSLKDIAQQAGISKGTLYYYYSAKDDIIYDIADCNMTKISNELLDLIEYANTNISPKEILKTLFEKILKDETNGRLHLYLLNEAITSNQELALRFQIRYASWRETIKTALHKVTEKNNIQDETFSYLIIALLDGFIIQNMIGNTQVPINDIIDMIHYFINH